METRKANTVVTSSCSWCCGDLVLLSSPAGSRVVCADCGRPTPEARPGAPGSIPHKRQRRPLSLGSNVPVPQMPDMPKSA